MLNFYQRYQAKVLASSVFAAFILGIICPHLFTHLTFISDAFINLLRLCALPIILTSLVVTIGSLLHLDQLKQIALKSIVFIIATEIIAVSIGLIVFNLVKVNYAINPHALLAGVSYSGSKLTTIEPNDIVNYIFSSNIFAALANYDVLPIVAFSIMLGVTCALHQQVAEPLLEVMKSAREIFLHLLDGIMYLAPLAIFILIGNAVAASYLSGSLATNLFGLLKFVSLFLMALSIHLLWQLTVVIVLYRRLTFTQIFTAATPIFTTAFISSSSLATLPIALNKAIELGAKDKVANFMLPICASMNFASGMMYEMVACLFFMHILGIHPDLVQQLLLALACILTGIAVGGIPETSMLSFVTIFTMAHVPLAAITILMPLDRILDRIRTMVNIFGNTCGSLIVSKSIK